MTDLIRYPNIRRLSSMRLSRRAKVMFVSHRDSGIVLDMATDDGSEERASESRVN